MLNLADSQRWRRVSSSLRTPHSRVCHMDWNWLKANFFFFLYISWSVSIRRVSPSRWRGEARVEAGQVRASEVRWGLRASNDSEKVSQSTSLYLLVWMFDVLCVNVLRTVSGRRVERQRKDCCLCTPSALPFVSLLSAPDMRVHSVGLQRHTRQPCLINNTCAGLCDLPLTFIRHFFRPLINNEELEHVTAELGAG